eukprot:g2165.t1
MGLRDFRKLKKLGAGSFGNVYKVRRLKDGETYALKEVDMRRLSMREKEDAVNEIRLLASMRHHNIVRYCEAFLEKDKLYIVLEFARFGDLSDMVKKQQTRRKYFSERKVMILFLQICKALSHLHSHKILHRDLKPQNIFVGDDGALKLGDFGCSKLLDRVMLARTQVGTPYYMSPEIFDNKRYNAKSDVWALGCILYELASLKVPFKARTLPQLARKVATSKTPLIPSVYSSNLRRLAKALLAKDPSRRPSLRQILRLSFVQEFIEGNRSDLDPPKDVTPTKMKLLQTIVVPKEGGRKAMRAMSFPESHYPRGRPQSSPAKPLPAKIKIARVRSESYGLPHIGRGVAGRLAREALYVKGTSPLKKRPGYKDPKVRRAIKWEQQRDAYAVKYAGAYPKKIIKERRMRVKARKPHVRPDREACAEDLDETRPDIVICLHANRSGTMLDLIAERRDEGQKNAFVPVILILGGTDVNVFAARGKEQERLLRKRCASSTAVVRFTEAMDIVPSLKTCARVLTIPQGVLIPGFSKDEAREAATIFSKWSRGGRRKVLLLLAGLRPVKDVLYVVDAVEKAFGKSGSFVLAVCGPRLDEAYAETVAEKTRGMCAVKLLDGGVSHPIASRLIAMSAAVVNTSISEGSSGVLLEAMALGVPVLARDIVANRKTLAQAVGGSDDVSNQSTDSIRTSNVDFIGPGALFRGPKGFVDAVRRVFREDDPIALARRERMSSIGRDSARRMALSEIAGWKHVMRCPG